MSSITRPQNVALANLRTNHDIEADGADDASLRSPAPSYRTEATLPPSYASVAKNAAYDSLENVPFGVGKLVKKVVPKPEPISEASHAKHTVASHAISAIVGTLAGAAALAPTAAAGACLYNVTGSWFAGRFNHSGAYDFHGGAVQGNYAAMGAALALPYVATLTVAKAVLNKKGFKVAAAVHTIIAPLAYAPAEGALAALVGASRGFDMQSVAASTVAGAAGAGFLTLIESPFTIAGLIATIAS